jgi:hypothetical protein
MLGHQGKFEGHQGKHFLQSRGTKATYFHKVFTETIDGFATEGLKILTVGWFGFN